MSATTQFVLAEQISFRAMSSADREREGGGFKTNTWKLPQFYQVLQGSIFSPKLILNKTKPTSI